MALKGSRWIKRMPYIVGVAVVLLIGLGFFLLRDVLDKAPQTKRVVQQVMIVPPPPPPPPPPEIKPPEPEIKEEKIEEPIPEQEPEPAPEAADEPAGDELGVDGDGEAGADGFGLAARKGGRSLLGGTQGSAIHWYGGKIKTVLEEELHELLADTHARKNTYAVILKIWVGTDGRMSKAELEGGSGNANVDKALQAAIPRLRLDMRKSPPENMPQPIRIRVTSR